MPLINGQKMACEPCIRGHRSTKCTHANERLMVPVRKPGRPLSACPHPRNQSCGCGNVTAAIPRKQKCHCGTSDNSQQAASPVIKTEKDDDATEPRSPTRASSGSVSGSSHRVQKSVSKAKNPTIDTSKLERMDPSQLNVIASPGGTQHTSPNATTSPMSQGLFSYGPMGVNGGGQPFATQPMMFPMFPQPMASPAMEQHTDGDFNKSPAVANGFHTNGKPATGSCCGGGSKKTTPSQPSPDHHSPVLETPAAPQKQSSCCSSTTNASNTSQAGTTSNAPAAVSPNGMMMSSGFPTPVAMAPNGMYPFYPQPTVFTYPPQYGSFMQPLQPDQWRQFIASMSFAQPPTQQNQANGFDMSTPIGFPAPGSTTVGAGTSHSCGCGEGCQCVGCAAHPYNEATQNYVRSAWTSMMEEPRMVSARTVNGVNGVNGHVDFGHTGAGGNNEVALMKDAINGTAHTNGAGVEHSDSSLMRETINGVAPKAINEVNSAGDGTVSPPAPQTPSEAASGMSEEQTLSANDFFFVSYPFGDSCAGDTANCPCGDDCQCIGCVIHGNASTDPVAL